MQTRVTIPEGLCHCGCGQRTRIAPQSHTKLGWVRGKPIRYIVGHGPKPSRRGRKNAPGRRVQCPDCGEMIVEYRMKQQHKKPGQVCVRVEPHSQAMPRFMEQVEKTDSCWLWTSSPDTKGYARFYFRDRLVRGHRFAYEALVGAIPAGMDLDHVCRVRLCVNPEHLEPVTRKENLRRGIHRNQHTNKTHCDAGHLLDAGNTRIDKNGHRSCRKCGRLRQRSHRARKASAGGLT